jgi:DNA-binding response OmpR family regulator
MTEATRQRILVVDDEPQIRQVLNAYLSGRGFDVREANDGDRALETFGAWQPDLVVTDLSMPRMGGISLCKEIRKRSAVPIIVLSVREEESTKVEALECGADDYVTKPFGTDELWHESERRCAEPAACVLKQPHTLWGGSAWTPLHIKPKSRVSEKCR